MKVAKIINEESELRLLRDKNKNKKILILEKFINK